jgi:hypothetical protein
MAKLATYAQAACKLGRILRVWPSWLRIRRLRVSCVESRGYGQVGYVYVGCTQVELNNLIITQFRNFEVTRLSVSLPVSSLQDT